MRRLSIGIYLLSAVLLGFSLPGCLVDYKTCGDCSGGGAPDSSVQDDLGGEGGRSVGTGGSVGIGGTGGSVGTGGTNEPCDGVCAGLMPRCDKTKNICVECLEDTHCGEATRVCDGEDGRCVECRRNEDCGDEVCDTGTRTCQECLDHDDCGDEFCDVVAKSCVECLVDTDCENPSRPECGEQNTCIGCRESPQCERFGEGFAHCEGEGGACVQCLDESHCDGNVCDPRSFTCTDFEAHALMVCQVCVHDAQCLLGQVCVEMTFGSPSPEVVGSYCLWRMTSTQEDGPGGSCGLNSRPFAKAATIDTMDGEKDVDVCQPRTTTCPAINDHASSPIGTCGVSGEGDAGCGARGFDDASCIQQEPPSTDLLCSYPCVGTDDRDCPEGVICADGYCGI